MDDELIKTSKLHEPFHIGLLKQGYVLAVKRKPKNDIIGGFIYREQRSWGFTEEQANYTHVEILGPDEWSVRVAPPLTKYVDVRKAYKGRFVRIMKPKIEGYEKDRNRKTVSWWAATGCGKRYDWMGVLRFKIPLLFHFKHLPFCSEHVLWSIRREFPAFLQTLKTYECMPAHSQTDEFELEWEGIVK